MTRGRNASARAVPLRRGRAEARRDPANALSGRLTLMLQTSIAAGMGRIHPAVLVSTGRGRRPAVEEV